MDYLLVVSIFSISSELNKEFPAIWFGWAIRTTTLSPVYTSNFYVTTFLWQFLFARVDEGNWPIFMWEIHLLKSWRVSFYVTNKNCHTRKIARVDDSSHKMWQILVALNLALRTRSKWQPPRRPAPLPVGIYWPDRVVTLMLETVKGKESL